MVDLGTMIEWNAVRTECLKVSENYTFHNLVLCSETRKAKNSIQMVQTKHIYRPQEKHDDIILPPDIN